MTAPSTAAGAAPSKAGFSFIYDELDWRRPRLFEAETGGSIDPGCWWAAERRAAEFWADIHPADRSFVLDAVARSKRQGVMLDLSFRMLDEERGEIRMNLRATVERIAGGARWRGVAIEEPGQAQGAPAAAQPAVLESAV